MDIETQYDCFLARLRHEVTALGHGGKAYIGKNIKGDGEPITKNPGAYIGQLIKKNPKKKASPEIQTAIADFVCGSYDRFINEGEQLLLTGKISSESVPQPSTPTPRRDDDTTDLCPICFQEEHDKAHSIIIQGFEDKEWAREMNRMLVEIEKHSPEQKNLVKSLIETVYKNIPQTGDIKKTGTTDRE